MILHLHSLRLKRNISDYEPPGIVTEQDAQEMVELAQQIRHHVEVWIRNNHKELAGEI